MRRIFLGFLILLCACGSDTDSDPRYVRIAISSNPKSLDPALTTDVNGGDIAAKIFNGLVKFDGAGIAPDLAETWVVSPDGLEYRFLIRGSVRFHNGRELIPDDVVRSFDRLMDTATQSQRRWVFDSVDRYYSEGKSVVIRLKRPCAPFLTLLAMPSGYIVPVEESAKYGQDFSHHVIGTGPFKLARWEDDRSVVLDRNADYFEGAPSVHGIIYRILTEPLTQLALLKSGSLDICEIPDAQMPAFRADETWSGRIQSVDQIVVGYVAINTERYTDSRVRAAFNMAVDRGRIIEKVRNGLGTPANGPVPPALAARRADGYAYDPAAARRLLEEAGFDFSRRLTILRNAPRGTLEPAEAVAGYLRDIGVHVIVEPMEFSSLIARLNRADYDLCLWNWFADYSDPENFLLPLFHSKNVGSSGNRARIADTGIDASIERVMALAAGPDRDSAVEAADRLIVAHAPWIFLWYPRTAMAVSPRVSGYTLPMIYNGFKGNTLVLVH